MERETVHVRPSLPSAIPRYLPANHLLALLVTVNSLFPSRLFLSTLHQIDFVWIFDLALCGFFGRTF